MKRVMAALVAGLLAAPASAGTLRDAAWAFGAASADFASTQYALAHCSSCREMNPLGPTMPMRAGLKLASVGIMVYTCHELRKGGHPRAATIGRWAFVAMNVGFAVHNLRQARR